MPRGGKRPGAGRKRRIPLGFEQLIRDFNSQSEKTLIVRLRRFHATKEQFRALLEAQKRRCLICNDLLNTNWVIDHDHLTGAARGILHSKCNTMLALANEDVKRLEAAIRYLKQRPLIVEPATAIPPAA